MTTLQQQTPEQRATRPSAPGHRERILAGLPVAERRFDLAGIATSVLQGGDGPPMILLHGPGEFAGKWFRVIPALTREHTVIAPDLPGHGNSVVRSGSLDEDHVVDWLGGLIDRTCSEPPMVVGHVLGGAIAARFASRHEKRLKQLVLVDTLGLAPFRPTLRFALGMLHFMVRPNEHSYDRFMRQCSHDLEALQHEMADKWTPYVAHQLEHSRQKAGRAALRTLMRKVGTPPIPESRLTGIRVPTTLIWGRHDRANSVKIAEEASRRFGWTLHVIEDCADDPPRDKPREFVYVLRKVMGHVARSSGSPI